MQQSPPSKKALLMTEADTIRELNRAKVAFQMRALTTALDLPCQPVEGTETAEGEDIGVHMNPNLESPHP